MTVKERLADLKRAFKRLECSDTSIKRRNARAGLFRILNEIKTDVLDTFPIIQSNGEMKNKPAKRPCCPFCGIPAKDWTTLGKHLIRKHNGGRQSSSCWCGSHLNTNKLKPITIWESLGRHLRGVHYKGKESLKDHIARGILIQSSK